MQVLKSKLITSQLTDDGKVPFKMSKRSADVRSSHHLVVTRIKLKVDATKGLCNNYQEGGGKTRGGHNVNSQPQKRKKLSDKMLEKGNSI